MDNPGMSRSMILKWQDPDYRRSQRDGRRASIAARVKTDLPEVPAGALHAVERRDGLPPELSERWDQTMREFFA